MLVNMLKSDRNVNFSNKMILNNSVSVNNYQMNKNSQKNVNKI